MECFEPINCYAAMLFALLGGITLGVLGTLIATQEAV